MDAHDSWSGPFKRDYFQMRDYFQNGTPVTVLASKRDYFQMRDYFQNGTPVTLGPDPRSRL